MGTARESPEVLDGIIEHIRYEVMQVVEFLRFGNAWCPALLHPELAKLTQESLLEAALLHFRCIIEFLGTQPDPKRIVARDYLRGWDWKIGGNISQVQDVHGRLAHLGVVRLSVAADGDFRWQSWLEGQALAVLAVFRDFLRRLQTEAPARYQLFLQPRDELPYIDLLDVLDPRLS